MIGPALAKRLMRCVVFWKLSAGNRAATEAQAHRPTKGMELIVREGADQAVDHTRNGYLDEVKRLISGKGRN